MYSTQLGFRRTREDREDHFLMWPKKMVGAQGDILVQPGFLEASGISHGRSVLERGKWAGGGEE